MKKLFFLLFVLVVSSVNADTTLPLQGNVISPSDSLIQYVGRISFLNPERPQFNYPGIQVNVCFEGTRLQMLCKPKSGYWMAQIDNAEPFKVAFTGRRDSLVTLCSALPQGIHTARLMYIIEGWDLHPEFRGFVTDGRLLPPPSLPDRRIEFIGNSITCGYGNEAMRPTDRYSYETQNHYLSYAQITARHLNAVAHIVARSGIGVYRNYNGPRTGTPDNRMDVQYEYTLYAERSIFRREGGVMNEPWDFRRFQPQVICINLGTNDLSTNNYDIKLLKDGYHKLLRLVRQHNPNSKIVFLTGTMLQKKELTICRQILDEVTREAHIAGDTHVYRFDMTPQGALGYGADWHPSYAQHQQMAKELTVFLRQLMLW